MAAFANHRLPPALARWEAGKVRRALKRAAHEAVLCGSKPQICVGTTTLRRLVFWLPEQAAQVRGWVVQHPAGAPALRRVSRVTLIMITIQLLGSRENKASHTPPCAGRLMWNMHGGKATLAPARPARPPVPIALQSSRRGAG